MRIARLVFIVLALLGGVSLLQSFDRLRYAHNKVLLDTKLAILAEARSDWYEGIVALSLERSVTQVAFALDSVISPDLRQLIDDQRAMSEALLDESFRVLGEKDGFDNGPTFFGQADRLRAEIAALRTEADALLSLPPDQRSQARVQDLPYELKAKIEQMFAASGLLVVEESEKSSEELTLTEIQSLAFEIREYGGRARTFYAIAALTGQPIPDVFMGEARIDNGHAKADWHKLKVTAQAAALAPELGAAIDFAEQEFRQTYLQSLDQMDAAMDRMRAGEDVAMPYDFQTFFAMSNAGLDAVAAIAPQAGVLVQDYWISQLQDSRRTRLISAVAVVLLAGLTAIALFALQRKLSRPLQAATKVLIDIADGKLDRQFRQKPRGLDEIKAIWESLEKLTVTLKATRDREAAEKEAEKRAKEGIVGELTMGLEKMARGELTHHIQDDYGEAYRKLVTNFNATNDALRSLITEVQDNSMQIADGSNDIANAVVDLSERTTAQEASVAQSVENLGTFSQNIRDLAENARQSDQYVQKAMETAQSSTAVVDTAMEAMERIKLSSDDIKKFTTVIDDIAFQTGLLALNAGVEAARAGEAGRGFAVVAQEIRDLAQRASESAADIKKVIEKSAEVVQYGAEQVSLTGGALREIAEIVQNIQTRIGDISQTSQQQTKGVSEIGGTMDQIDDMTKQNAAMVDQANSVGGALRAKAAALSDAVGRFVIEGPDQHERAAPGLNSDPYNVVHEARWAG